MRNIDKIKQNIGTIVFDHISALNKDQLMQMRNECDHEIELEHITNGKSPRYFALMDETWLISYRLQ